MSGGTEDPFVGIHYYVAGYVSQSGVVPAPLSSPMTFSQVMAHRPKDCRFAVAQMYRVRTAKGSTVAHPKYAADPSPSGPFIVWDLDDDQLRRGQRTNPDGLIAPPSPMWTGETADDMVMKALALYAALKS